MSEHMRHFALTRAKAAMERTCCMMEHSKKGVQTVERYIPQCRLTAKSKDCKAAYPSDDHIASQKENKIGDQNCGISDHPSVRGRVRPSFVPLGHNVPSTGRDVMRGGHKDLKPRETGHWSPPDELSIEHRRCHRLFWDTSHFHLELLFPGRSEGNRNKQGDRQDM